MARMIKFRAWDKERNEMRRVTQMEWNEWWVSTEYVEDAKYGRPQPQVFGERNSFQNERTDRHILMQYTGLKDKNGKEIYEGDILTGYNGIGTSPEELHVIAFFQADVRYMAVYADKYGTGNWDDGDENIGLVWVHCEVIGNIYETPELIGRTANDSTESAE